jgi:NADPH-dependent 2,4-dienoyl-CoA reductase/sulfur reductase-like enzyme
MKKLVAIGGSDAGISATLGAKEMDPDGNVDVVVADQYPNFSICGLSFYLSGEVQDRKTLTHRTAADIENEGIHLLMEHTTSSIDPHTKQDTLGKSRASLGCLESKSIDACLQDFGFCGKAHPIETKAFPLFHPR